MDKLKTLLIFLTIGLLSTLFISSYHKYGVITTYHSDGIEEVLFSINPPAEKTGAPGDGNCTDCHSGSTQSAVGTVTYDFSDPSDEYLPGQSYTIILSVASTVKNGFQMSIRDASNNSVGTLNAGTNSNVVTSGGKEYIGHNTSLSENLFSFTWDAPVADAGNLTAYYSFVVANNASGNSGDQIYLGQESITISPLAQISAYDQLNNECQVIVDANNKQLTLNYLTLNKSSVFINLIDVSGKLVYREDFGTKTPGNYTEIVDYSRLPTSGVYFVSLLIDNYAINKKVFLY